MAHKRFKSKTLRHHGRDVQVDAVEVANPNNPDIPAIRVTARVGNTVVEGTVTLAPVDGGMSVPDDGHVQRMLDHQRNQCAKAAAMRDAIKTQLASVD